MCHQRTDCGSPVLDNQHIYDIDFPLTNLLKPFPKNFFKHLVLHLVPSPMFISSFQKRCNNQSPLFCFVSIFHFRLFKKKSFVVAPLPENRVSMAQKKKLSLGLNFSMKIPIRACNVFISYSEKRLAQKFCVWRGRQETFIAVGRSSF